MANARSALRQTPLVQAMSRQRDRTDVELPLTIPPLAQATSQQRALDPGNVDPPQRRTDAPTIDTKLNTTGIDPEILNVVFSRHGCHSNILIHGGFQ
jgi:hypothetical protein